MENKVDKNAQIIIGFSPDKDNVRLEYKGELTYAQSILMLSTGMLRSANIFIEACQKEGAGFEQEKKVRQYCHDDLNLKVSALLDLICPEEFRETDFTEEAQSALADENEYTELKFKSMQYDKLVAAQGTTGKIPAKAKFNKKGEVTL